MKHHPLCFQTQNPEVAYRAQLEQLAQMGFVDRARNIQGETFDAWTFVQ